MEEFLCLEETKSSQKRRFVFRGSRDRGRRGGSFGRVKMIAIFGRYLNVQRQRETFYTAAAAAITASAALSPSATAAHAQTAGALHRVDRRTAALAGTADVDDAIR